MHSNIKKIFLTILVVILPTISFCINSDIINVNIFSKIEYSANLLQYPEITEVSLKHKFLYQDNISNKIKYLDNTPITDNTILALEESRNLNNIQPTNFFGWTLKRSNIRMYPTDSVLKYHLKDQNDRNQYSSIGTFEPLVILHLSTDKKWGYVQTFFTRGWLKLSDLTTTNRKTFLEIFSMDKLAVIKNNLPIDNFTFNIGDKIPIISENINSYNVLLPNMQSILIPKNNSLYIKNPKYNISIINYIIEQLIGKMYDWGGKNGLWDCSSLIMDIYRVFGIHLPRNSNHQAEVGKLLLEYPFTKEKFYETLKTANPYCTFLYMKGHIMLYTGIENNDYSIVHAVQTIDGNIIDAIVKQYLIKDNLHIENKVLKIVTICDK
ncbi:MAG: SH3 domain-containing protein [Deferribacterales bacterium]